MKRGLSLVLSVLLIVSFVFGGLPETTAWADEAPGIPTGLAAVADSSTKITVS